MLMGFINLASFTEIKISTDTALVSDTLNWASSTSVAGNLVMYLRGLLSSSLTKMINHQSLERLSGIGLNLFLDNLDKIGVELVLEGAGTVASSARHALLVDLGSVTLKAHDAFIIRNGFFLVLRAKDLAVNFLRDGFSLELASLALCLDRSIAESFADVFHSLRTNILGINYCVELLLIGENIVGIASEVLQIDIFGTSLNSHCV